MIIDVTHVILGDVRPGGRGGGKAARESIRKWLEENVGQFYCTETRFCADRAIGSGWEFGARIVEQPSGYGKSWFVDIDNEQLATMFVLRWL